MTRLALHNSIHFTVDSGALKGYFVLLIHLLIE